MLPRLLGVAIPPGLSGLLNEGEPTAPRPSATVLVLRGTAPFEVLFMQRPGGAEFAPDAFVFPGGTLHTEDETFGDPLRAAGIRELFEEMGILVARRLDGRTARAADCDRLREKLAAGASWTGALESLGLEPALDRLVLFTRWITPVALKRRYDARFYITRLPPGQHEHPHAGEVVGWRWLTPARALAAEDMTMVFVTRRVLGALAHEADASRLIAKVRRRREAPAITPRVVRGASGFQVVAEELPLAFAQEHWTGDAPPPGAHRHRVRQRS